MPHEDARREVGDEAVWSLSTAKPGNGVDQLRDNNVDTYWQSDGSQPHLINIQFHKKMTLKEVALYLDYKLDESYTPKKISIRCGSTVHDLKEIHAQSITEPNGWVTIPLSISKDEEEEFHLVYLLPSDTGVFIAVIALQTDPTADVFPAGGDHCDAPEWPRHAHSTGEDLRPTRAECARPIHPGAID